MPDWKEMSKETIKEFRDNGGKVGGFFEGAPLLLITTKGAKTGNSHTTPVMYLPDGDRQVIFATKAGAQENPAWYHNLLAEPTVTVEVREETFTAKAGVANREERDRLYGKQASIYPQFAEYETKTTRKIPVVVLERKS